MAALRAVLLCLCSAASLVASIPADEADLTDGVFIAHHVPELVYSQAPANACADYGPHALTDPALQINRIDATGSLSTWFVLAGWFQPKEFCTVQFGLGGYDPSIYAILTAGPCAPGPCTEVPSPGWPGPNQGITVLSNATPWSGSALTPVFFFTGYAYEGETLIPLGPDPSPPEPFGGFTNCGWPSESWPAVCFGAMGINTAGLACDPGEGPPRACCTGELCQILTYVDCLAIGGDWRSGVQSCEPNPCLPLQYACCLGEICEVLTAAACAAAGGTWLEGTGECSPNPCAHNACCLQEACELLTLHDCLVSGGQWLEGVASCEAEPCRLRACCVGASCTVVREDVCAGLGGQWIEDLMSCSPFPCAEAACCIDGACSIMLPGDCFAAGGEAWPERTSCDPDPCDEFIEIRADGSGEYLTIQLGIAAAHEGMTVLLHDGIFTGQGNRDIDFQGKAITVRSSGGDPAACVIDCQASATDRHRGIVFGPADGPAAVFEGVTITHGYGHSAAPESYGGGAILCLPGSAPTIRNVVMIANEGRDGGGLAAYGASPHVTSCRFIENAVGQFCGGGVYCSDSDARFAGCTFLRNTCNFYGCAVAVASGTPSFTNCTIVGNISAFNYGAIYCGSPAAAPFVTHSIIASNDACAATAEIGVPDLACCDVYGNTWGDWTGCLHGLLGFNGNISADPLFCDLAGDDYRLDPASPCAPFTAPNAECDLIGAWPVGCATVVAACCTGEACTLTSEQGCLAGGGEWLPGVGGCDPQPCGAWRACCFGRTCQVTAEQRCLALGGTWLPDDLICDASSCARQIALEPGGAGQYPTIQAAIDAAHNRDTIVLADGVYSGDGNQDLLVSGKNLVIRSESGLPEQCTVSCSSVGAHRGVVFQSPCGSGTRLQGIRITGGYATGYPGSGGGVHIGVKTAPMLSDCIIQGCTALEMGGGVYCAEGSLPTLQECTLSANFALGAGGGLYVEDDDFVTAEPHTTIRGCRFEDNHAGSGGGLGVGHNAHPVIQDCDFVDNLAEDNGGGADLSYPCYPTLVGCRFQGNVAHGIGGAIRSFGAGGVIADCVLEGNQAEEGGGIALDAYGEPEVRDCHFVGNAAAQRGGGLFRIGSLHTGSDIARCDFIGNTAPQGGGAYVNGDDPDDVGFVDCLFASNEASAEGGAICAVWYCRLTRCTLADNSAPSGSAVSITHVQETSTLQNSIIAYNRASPACMNGYFTMACCDAYGNEFGVGYPAGQIGQDGNFAADPLFCRDLDPEEPYGLQESSPCAPAQSPACGLIGARPVACPPLSDVEAPVNLEGVPRVRWLGSAPNPLRAATQITFTVPAGPGMEAIDVTIHDAAGRLVRTLTCRPERPGRPGRPGIQSLVWDGRDAAGTLVPSGIYPCRLSAGGQYDAGRVVVIR